MTNKSAEISSVDGRKKCSITLFIDYIKGYVFLGLHWRRLATWYREDLNTKAYRNTNKRGPQWKNLIRRITNMTMKTWLKMYQLHQNMCENFPHCTPPPNVKNIRKFSSFENSKAWVSI